jgi:hypothetical protein
MFSAILRKDPDRPGDRDGGPSRRIVGDDDVPAAEMVSRTSMGSGT